jgi:hypothetical protein
VHTSLVFGMDPEQKKVSVCDHFYQGKYGEKLINYSAYEKAYQEVDDLLRNGYFEKSQVKNRAHEVDYVYYIKPINGHYAFNIELFKYDLTSYLNSDNNIGFMGKKDNFYSSYSDCAYGLDTYNLLIDYLNNLSEGKIEFEDYRSFTFLKEHKTLMQKRLVYLYDKGYLSCDSTVTRWAEICDAFTLIQDLFIKYTITDNQETLKKILALIYDTRRVEKEVLKALCLTLEKTGNAQVI